MFSVTVGISYLVVCHELTRHGISAEAAQIVLNIPIKKTMVPLNVTHTAIVTRTRQAEILLPGINLTDETESLPRAKTPLRHMLSTLISFFAETYKAVFGFMHGPPIHDALTIAYVAHPELFACKRYHVDIELTGIHTVGETVVDLLDYKKSDETWGRTGMNCIVAQSVNVSLVHLHRTIAYCSSDQVDEFFKLLLECIARCDEVSPLNVPQAPGP